MKPPLIGAEPSHFTRRTRREDLLKSSGEANNLYTMAPRPLTSKESAFVRWVLGQQKQSFVILAAGLTPFVVAALGGLAYAVREKSGTFETIDYIVLFGVLAMILLLLRFASNIVLNRLKIEFPDMALPLSGVYQLKQVSSMTTSVDTYTKVPIMAPMIGDHMVESGSSWQFMEGEFYQAEAVPLELSDAETVLYKTRHRHLILVRKGGGRTLRIEEDIDLGLLKTRILTPMVILILSILYLFALGMAHAFSLGAQVDQALQVAMLVILLIDVLQIVAIVRARKLLSKIRNHQVRA